MPDAITVRAGAIARERLAREGWHPALFDTLVGASGGPKFLGIAGLDRYLFSDFLQRSDHSMHLIGSSIGTWRHAALAARDPLASLAVLVERYTEQYYDPADKRSVVRWTEFDLADKSIRDHVANGMRLTHLAIEYDSTVSFVLNEAGVISKMRFIGMDDDSEGELDPLARLDAEFALMNGTLRQMRA